MSALKNGYRALTLLSRAADTSTPEHSSVLAFLRENQVKVQGLLAKRAAEEERNKKLSTAPIEGRVRLLTRVSPEGVSPPVYEATNPPRRLEEIPSGIRKPPTLSDTGGVPFLRLGKPQPRFLERVLRQKSQFRARKIEKSGEMQDEEMWVAKLEDEWEKAVEKLMRREGMEVETEGGEKEVTYRQTMSEAITHLGEHLEAERLDLVARGQAMWRIVLAEKELALKEEKERMVREGREGEEVKLKDWKRPVWDKGRSRVKTEGKGAENNT